MRLTASSEDAITDLHGMVEGMTEVAADDGDKEGQASLEGLMAICAEMVPGRPAEIPEGIRAVARKVLENLADGADHDPTAMSVEE